MFEKDLVEEIKYLNDKGYSVERISLELKVSSCKIRDLIKRYGIRKYTKKKSIELDEKRVIYLYAEEGLSQGIIAGRFGVSINVIHRILEKHNLTKSQF